MSRATARNAVVQWLNAGQVQNAKTVYRSFPKLIDGRDFYDTGQGSGAVIIPELASSHAYPITIGGAHGGTWRRDYVVTLHLMFRSNRPSSEDAMEDYDAVVDALETRLLADHTLNDSTVWQVAEGPNGITHSHGTPALDDDVTEIYGTVKADLSEFFTA